MGLLTGKTALIFGVANDHSIAWGVAGVNNNIINFAVKSGYEIASAADATL